jgi:hypothetical protein
VTLREVGELRLYFTPIAPDELTLKILALSISGITGFSQGNAGNQIQ